MKSTTKKTLTEALLNVYRTKEDTKRLSKETKIAQGYTDIHFPEFDIHHKTIDNISIPVNWSFICIITSFICSESSCWTLVMISSFMSLIILDTSSFHLDGVCELLDGGELLKFCIMLVMIDMYVWSLRYCFGGVTEIELLLLDVKVMMMGVCNDSVRM